MSQTQQTQVETQPGTQSGAQDGVGVGTSAEQQQGLREKNRQLTKQYRNVHYQIRSKADDLSDPHKTQHLSDMISHVNLLSKQVERPSEQADDSEAFCELAIKGAEMSKRVAAGKGRTINDFLRHLKAIYVAGGNAQEEGEVNPNAFNWAKMGRDTSMFFYSAPGVSCLLGPLDQLPKVKKQIQRLARKPVGRAVAPTELTSEAPEAREKRETERNMETMREILKSKPDGITNRMARLSKSDPKNTQGIMVHYNDTRKDESEGGSKNRSQLVLAYDMQDWQKWKKYVLPEDCLMVHRSEHDDEALAQQTQMQADIDSHPADQHSTQDSQEESEGEPSQASRKRKSLLLGQEQNGKSKKGQHRLSRAS